MTWGELKKHAESLNVSDETEVMLANNCTPIADLFLDTVWGFMLIGGYYPNGDE